MLTGKNFHKSISLLLAMVMTVYITMSGVSTFAKADTITDKNFDLVEITDFHGALESSAGLPVAGVLGQHVKDILTSNPKGTLVIGGGDLYQGSALSNILKGVPVRDFMNGIGMEVTALGNHEFDWGLDTITNTTMVGANYSIVCANIRKSSDKSLLYPASKIITKNGVRIAVIGAITTETPTIVMPALVANLTFTDPVTEINSEAKRIRDGNLADVVLAVIHEGSTINPVTGKTVLDTAANLVNVNAVFAGHSHTIINTSTTNGVPVEIANNAGKGLTDLKMVYHADKTVTFTNAASAYVALDKAGDPAGYAAITPITDPASMKIVADAKTQVGPTINEVLCTIPQTLTRTQLNTPYGESYVGNWAADVIRKAVSADVGMQNNGGLRIDLPAGNITVGTMYTIMPFDNIINTVTMTKAQLKVVLEQAVMDNGKGIAISGIKFTYDSLKPSMSRVTLITRENGTAISDTEKLKVAAPDFVATGGDGFVGFKDAAVVSSLVVAGTNVREALIADAKGNKGIITQLNGRLENLSKTISIIATSDLHGNIYPIDYATGLAANVGLAKISTYVNSVRATNPNVMLVDNGDTIQGTPLSYYYDKIDTKSEYPMSKVMGAMKYDTWTLGNHEFNYGLDTLNRIIGDANKENINVLSANTYNAANSNFVKPYIIKPMNVNGKIINVGILGMTTKTIPSWENPSNYSGLHFNDLVLEGKKWVPIMKTAGADIIIATIHSGEESTTDTIPENQIKAVATSVDGIDAIVAGHTHKNIVQDEFTSPSGKKVLVTEPLNAGKNVCQVDISVNADGSIGKIATKNIAMDTSIVADPAILKLAQSYEDATIAYTNTVIGTSTGSFEGANQTMAPNALMDLINKVQMNAAKTQLSIAAPLSATAAIPAGDVKIKDLMNVYVFENFLYGIKMNGDQLKNWLEYSVRYYAQVAKPGDAIVKDAKANIPDYNLDLLYGANYDVDLTEPACTVDPITGLVTSGKRIKNLMISGKVVKPTDTYTVAINNYRKNGGGGFMKAVGLSTTDDSILTYDSAKALGDDGQVRNLMISYIQTNKIITPTLANNWKLSAASVTQKLDLPKTGSLVDSSTLISIGSLTVLFGVLILVSSKNKKDEEKHVA